jgi:hypothetical protein
LSPNGEADGLLSFNERPLTEQRHFLCGLLAVAGAFTVVQPKYLACLKVNIVKNTFTKKVPMATIEI